MNATTRPAISKPAAMSRPAASQARPKMTMNPEKYPELRNALAGIQKALYLAQAGMELLDPDEPKGLSFIAEGLRANLAQIEEEMEAAEKAAIAVAPRLNTRDATMVVVKALVAANGLDVAEADLPALARAYQAESKEAGEGSTCGEVLRGAMRRLDAMRQGGGGA
nr:hypothetical protein [uncultured Roseococcus sp.]